MNGEAPEFSELHRRLRSCLRFAGVTVSATAVSLIGLAIPAIADDLPERIGFNRDIRPILAENCFQCHGPDAGQRQAELRLDEPASAFRQRKSQRVIVPGEPKASALVRRISTGDESQRMPPKDSGRTLTEEQRRLLIRWIEQGAEYQQHWAFLAPQRASLPEVRAPAWARTPIDRFILATLERERLEPSPEAARETLIRRVTLDLTGLPPTPDEVAAFVNDHRPGAWSRVVDRLLASPHYGERMALEWLDAARYADTHGYLFDTQRFMWRWRDQVIESFNDNQPFDEFTVEQLAGDLLPDATLAQKIASGFNRNHVINNEAGATPQEYYVENILDRVNTTATVWMGLTASCAQCHDHKYDPISQREYYQLYAFFNNLPEAGLDGFNANAKPLITAPTTSQQARIDRLERDLKAAETTFGPVKDQLGPARAQWEREFCQPVETVTDGLIASLPVDGGTKNRAGSGLSAEFRDGMAAHEEGFFGKAVSLDGQRYLDVGDVGRFALSNPFTLSAWVFPTKVNGRRSIFSRMEPPEVGFRGYTLQLVAGAPALFLVHQFPENLLQVQAKKKLEAHRWHHVLCVYDGSGKVAGVKLFVDGELQESDITIDKLTGTFETEKPLHVGNGYPAAKFVGRIDDVRVFDRALNDDEIKRLPGLSIHSLLPVKEKERTAEVTRRIRDYFLEHAAPAEWREPFELVARLREEKKKAVRDLPNVMVMQELDKPRETKMLARGAWDSPGEAVAAGTPRDRQPVLADVLRHGARSYLRRLWCPGRSAVASGAARLAGD